MVCMLQAWLIWLACVEGFDDLRTHAMKSACVLSDPSVQALLGLLVWRGGERRLKSSLFD